MFKLFLISWTSVFVLCISLLCPKANTAQRTGRLLMRRVGVAELDQRFSEVAETFNEQQQEYEVMVRHVNNLEQSCGCAHGVMLAFADCVVKIAEEYGE